MVQSSSNNTSTRTRRKRTHLNFYQLAILQQSFDNNPLPDNAIRSHLARQLGVTDRTVQIWFQNRRAKERRSIKSGDSNQQDHIQHDVKGSTTRCQPTFRSLVTPEQYEHRRSIKQRCGKKPNTTPTATTTTYSQHQSTTTISSTSDNLVPDITQNELVPAGQSSSCLDTPPPSSLSFMAHTLRIGMWSRFAQGDGWDLKCHIDPITRQVVWQVQVQGGDLFRVHISFDAIQQIRLISGNQQQQALEIEVHDPSMVLFSMRRMHMDARWVLCSDFTENQQASRERVHILQGSYDHFQHVLFNATALTPDLASKLLLVPPSICREQTLSPSVTPEPFTTTTPFLPGWSTGTNMDRHYQQKMHEWGYNPIHPIDNAMLFLSPPSF
ncbi:homeobox-domain-containing protein [Lichtheimia hyalospora FSU 10163]|nr:homeobox-domain-containing protein [Lichtheimia hyalospora FSU 10163]